MRQNVLILGSVIYFLSLSPIGSACTHNDSPRSSNPDDTDNQSISEAGQLSGETDKNNSSQNELQPPYFGFLQLRVEHNLGDDDCLQSDSCRIRSNREEDIRSWLSRVKQDSTLGVLHWNRAIPYNVFSESPKRGTRTVEYYDSRLPNHVLNWIKAFRTHFQDRRKSFLQVSALDGPRLRPAKQYISEGKNRHIARSPCPKLNPSASFEIRTEDGGTRSINFRDTYSNFLKYLYKKLEPDYFALVVEANLFKKHCPNRWSGFVKLYQDIYEDIREAVGPAPLLFATFTYSDILSYNLERCTGGLKTIGCDETVGEKPYRPPTPDRCFDIKPSAIKDLERGGHLDLLGLSLYPDGFLMRTPGGPAAFEVHPPDSDGTEDCLNKVVMPKALNPWQQLDRLDWNKPVAITETSSRSCTVWQWFDNDTGSGFYRLPATRETQKFWLRRAIDASRKRDMAFLVQSLYEDFQPISRSFVQSVENPGSFNAINLWACSGFYTQDKIPKPTVVEHWPPSKKRTR